MKKMSLCILAALTLSCYSLSGAAAKSSPAPAKYEIVKENECETETKNCPENELRAYGTAISPRKDFAQDKAALVAKGRIASDMEAIISNAMEEYMKDLGLDEDITNQEETERTIKLTAKTTLRNCKTVCSKVYQLPNGNYESHVCVSVPNEVVIKVAEAAMNNLSEKQGKPLNTVKAKEKISKSAAERRRELKESR